MMNCRVLIRGHGPRYRLQYAQEERVPAKNIDAQFYEILYPKNNI